MNSETLRSTGNWGLLLAIISTVGAVMAVVAAVKAGLIETLGALAWASADVIACLALATACLGLKDAANGGGDRALTRALTSLRSHLKVQFIALALAFGPVLLLAASCGLAAL